MEPFRYHVFACNQEKPDGIPCCSARGSAKVLDALRSEIKSRGLFDDVQITTCNSIGLCENGPNMIVYPEGIWYSGLKPEDIPEIVESHFQHHKPVMRLVRSDPADVKAEIIPNRNRSLQRLREKELAGAK